MFRSSRGRSRMSWLPDGLDQASSSRGKPPCPPRGSVPCHFHGARRCSSAPVLAEYTDNSPRDRPASGRDESVTVEPISFVPSGVTNTCQGGDSPCLGLSARSLPPARLPPGARVSIRYTCVVAGGCQGSAAWRDRVRITSHCWSTSVRPSAVQAPFTLSCGVHVTGGDTQRRTRPVPRLITSSTAGCPPPPKARASRAPVGDR